jgi:hypothetical protein
LKKQFIVLACVFASTAAAQLGDYLGPGVLSRGAGDIGQRGGEQVDLRYFINASAVYDSGLQPFAVDSKGNLVSVNGLYGVQLGFGAYGTHRWRRARLGLDYGGTLYHYVNNSFYDGSNHNLALGYTYQQSRRLSFDLRQVAGTSKLGNYGALYGSSYTDINTSTVTQPTGSLFDSRSYYLQSTMDVNYMSSARTTFTAGGDGFLVKRASPLLAGVTGYNLHGSVRHRLSKNQTIGVNYGHVYFSFPRQFGESTMNNAEASFHTSLGKIWTFTVQGGVFLAEVSGLQSFALDPVTAALLGQNTGVRAFYRNIIYPSGGASLTGHLNKTSYVSLLYSRTIVPGNGLYLTSQQESAIGSYNYTGVRKLNVNISGGYSTLNGIGQGLQNYSQVTGGAGFTYSLTHALQVIGRYDARHQEIDLAGALHNSSRATLGLGFSPGNVPLSLW